MAATACQTETVLGHPVRFVAADGQSAGLAWAVLDDLYSAMGMPDELRKRWLRETRTIAGATKTAAIEGKISVLVSDPIARQTIGLLIKLGAIGEAFALDYCRAVLLASRAAHAHLPSGESDAFIRSHFDGGAA